jgi:alcohol dehydrogenase class IV
MAPTGRTEFDPGVVAEPPAFVDALSRTSAFVITGRGVRATEIVGRVERILAGAGLEHAVHDDVGPNPSTRRVRPPCRARLRQCGDAAVIPLSAVSALDAMKGISLLAGNAGAPATDADPLWAAADGLSLIPVPTTSGTGAETNGFGATEYTCTRRKVHIGRHDARTELHGPGDLGALGSSAGCVNSASRPACFGRSRPTRSPRTPRGTRRSRKPSHCSVPCTDP